MADLALVFWTSGCMGHVPGLSHLFIVMELQDLCGRNVRTCSKVDGGGETGDRNEPPFLLSS